MGQRIGMVLVIVAAIQFYIINEDDMSTVQLRIGLLCCSLAVAYCSAPLASVGQVVATGSTQSLPFYLILATVLVTGQWTLYGVIIKDNFVLVPNLLGCLVATFQLSLFSVYPTSSSIEKHVV